MPACWELALKGTQGPLPTGHHTCLCSQRVVTCQEWNGGAGRKKVSSPRRKEWFWDQSWPWKWHCLPCCSEKLFSYTEAGWWERSCTGHHTVSLLSFQFFKHRDGYKEEHWEVCVCVKERKSLEKQAVFYFPGHLRALSWGKPRRAWWGPLIIQSSVLQLVAFLLTDNQRRQRLLEINGRSSSPFPFHPTPCLTSDLRAPPPPLRRSPHPTDAKRQWKHDGMPGGMNPAAWPLGPQGRGCFWGVQACHSCYPAPSPKDPGQPRCPAGAGCSTWLASLGSDSLDRQFATATCI